MEITFALGASIFLISGFVFVMVRIADEIYHDKAVS